MKPFQFRLAGLLAYREAEERKAAFELSVAQASREMCREELNDAEDQQRKSLESLASEDRAYRHCQMEALGGSGDWSLRLDFARVKIDLAMAELGRHAKAVENARKRLETADESVRMAGQTLKLAARAKVQIRILRDQKRHRYLKARELADMAQAAEAGATMHYLTETECVEDFSETTERRYER